MKELIFLFSFFFRNAQDLIDEFWKKKKAENKARKSIDQKPLSKPRKSTGKEESLGSTSATKRGRKSRTKDSDDEDVVDKPKKKLRDGKNNSSKRRKATQPPTSRGDTTADEDIPIGDMKNFMTVPSWEHIVASVDTVEQTEDGGLDVYFRLCVHQFFGFKSAKFEM